jgi:hypothetical protein
LSPSKPSSKSVHKTSNTSKLGSSFDEDAKSIHAKVISIKSFRSSSKDDKKIIMKYGNTFKSFLKKHKVKFSKPLDEVWKEIDSEKLGQLDKAQSKLFMEMA